MSFLTELRDKKDLGRVTIISREVTETTPFEVENYPYGFRLKTKARYWIETTGKGQRVVFQTLNPKTLAWNTPKKSVYSDLIILYRDEENGHIENARLDFGYNDADDLNAFLALFAKENVLTPFQRQQINYFKAILETRKYVKVEIKGGLETEAEREANEAQQKQVKAKLGLIFAHEYQKIKNKEVI
jgi:hypothetical protein